MKLKIRILAACFVALACNAAWADNINKCYWWPSGTSERRTIDLIPSPVMSLNQAAIGSVMLSLTFDRSNTEGLYKCPMTVSRVNWSYRLEKGVLADGFSDVYKTGLTGVGIRFIVVNRQFTLPTQGNYWNAPALSNQMSANIRLEFVRTGRDVIPGNINMDFSFLVQVDEWNAGQINIRGPISLVTQNYFSGCAGVEENIRVPMGRVAIAQIGNVPANELNLDVICAGMPAGTKLPVKVFFEGNSDGPGRLNLQPGGARGVEILLTNEHGVGLPFSKANNMSMTWIRTEPKGEVYRLPIQARYAQKPSQRVEVGKADATVNYVIEYN